MASIQNDARLFGLDLSGFGQAVHAALLGMVRWPVVKWLQPRLAVRVWLPNGTTARSLGPDYPLIDLKPGAPGKYRFEAAQLPEEVLLRRVVVLPALTQAEAAAALALEAQTQSPFPADQLLWVSRAVSQQTSHTHELVLTSRALVRSHLDTLSMESARSQPPEIWVTVGGGVHLVMPGFGELRRQQQVRNGLRVNAVLCMLALCLALAAAVSPTLQLRLRVLDAVSQHTALQQQVAPVLQQREAYVKVQEQLQSIQDTMGTPVSAVQALDMVTRAVPNDTSVLTFQLQSSDAPGKPARVQITGQTNNTAALMQLLGQQRGVREVRAPTPAVKPPGATKESYSIEFSVGLSAQESNP